MCLNFKMFLFFIFYTSLKIFFPMGQEDKDYFTQSMKLLFKNEYFISHQDFFYFQLDAQWNGRYMNLYKNWLEFMFTDL